MEKKKISDINTDKSKTGVLYITENDNMFIAPEGISDDEYKRISLETDRNAFKEKLKAIEASLKESEAEKEPEKKINNIDNGEKSEIIKQTTPLTTEKPLFLKKKDGFKNILVLDTETTGLSPSKGDEILQFSAIDGNGNTLLNSYIHPEHRKRWPKAQKKNGISYETVKDAPQFSELKDKIQSLIDNADLIISYNGKFDMDFLQTYGIKVDPEIPHIDINKKFRNIPRQQPLDGTKLRYQLIDAAKHFGISFNPHNSLEDVQATLKVAKKIYGQNLENLTEEEITKNSPSKMPPKKMETPEFRASIYKAGYQALKNQKLLGEIRQNPKLSKLNAKITKAFENPDDKRAMNSLAGSLGRYVMGKDPAMVENFSKKQRETKVANQINNEMMDSVIPAFSVMTKNGMKHYKNMKIVQFDTESNLYLLDNGKDKIKVSVSTFQTIAHPEILEIKKNEFENAETIEEGPAFIANVTKIPEFSMITTNGIQTFKDLKVQKYNEAENSYTLSNGNTSITVTGDTFKEITSPERFKKQFDENTPAYEKLIESQYDAYFKQWDNTSNNFIHNLSVYCRKEANSPLDALTISKEIISRMDKEEKEKTRLLLKQIAKKDETINQVLIRTYYEAVQGVPLNKNTILQKENSIAKPFNDTISSPGALVDNNSKLRIGDTISNMAFNVPKAFGHGKDRLFEDLTVISASKDGNNIILMDKNRSFYEMPRDSVLEGYNKQQEKLQKAELKQKYHNRIDIGWER